MKNTIKTSLILMTLLATQFNLFGQKIDPEEKEKNTSIVAIATSAQCQDCKERIEYELTFTKGIVKADFDAMTNKLLVKYKSKKLNVDEIRLIIAGMGYDADFVKADKGAFKVLPKTCKSSIIAQTKKK